MNTELNLIPRPVSLSVFEQQTDLAAFDTLTCGGLNQEAIGQLLSRFPSLSVKQAIGNAPQAYFLTLTSQADAPTPMLPEDRPDAYVLQITQNGVRIDAVSEAALFYGLQTLVQLPNACPCLVISDYAAIKLRMAHLDLKGYLPHFEILKDELRRLARYKINAVLLEIENKYAFDCAPDIAVPGAYTYEQLRELSKFAKALHITVVPKLQSIAHVDYILKHARYAHLRENGKNGYSFQFCPMNPEVHTLWKAMCTELMECFAEHGPYFHIGGDEAGNLGECPECQKLGAAQVYLHRVSECIDFVCEKGWTPIIWDDIVRNGRRRFTSEEEAHIREALGSRAVFMYWAYGYRGNGNAFPYIDTYQAAGLRVWGASGYSGCCNWSGSLPHLEWRSLNCDTWARAAVEKDLECVCTTGWTRIGSADCPAEPLESSWFTVIYAAAGLWNPETDELDTFVKKCALQLYGKEPDDALRSAIFNIAKAPYDYRSLLSLTEEDYDEMTFLRFVAGAECILGTLAELQAFLGYYQGKLGDRLEDYRLRHLTRMVNRHYDGLLQFRDRLKPMLSRYYQDVTVEEFLITRFGYPLKICTDAKALIENTKPF